jgi:hypothetical protein
MPIPRRKLWNPNWKEAAMTEAQRITLFMENLANLCEEYGVTIHTESMQGWSPTLVDDAEYYAVLPTGAPPEDIRKAAISPSECW